MTKTLNQIIFFFLHQNQNIFFSNIGNQNIFLEKKHNPPPPLQVKWSVPNKIVMLWLISFNQQMKKKNGLLQTFFYDFLKIQVTNWVREILVTCENQLSIIYWFLLRYTVIIYKFTQGNLDAKKIASSRFQSPVKKKNRKLRYWRPTARSLVLQYTVPTNEYRNQIGLNLKAL